ncbi:Hypothetical predicted protein [Olea europaea subsp. europaea]|uniref:Uncharacterized protein n=1 Tax=Olea europaea subsp. europaea TaxID=158383 RepID=A0A8S0RLB6_OLEEU|nr:Hypothetical predicted protein [Olea europaea subsp. europaea]
MAKTRSSDQRSQSKKAVYPPPEEKQFERRFATKPGDDERSHKRLVIFSQVTENNDLLRHLAAEYGTCAYRAQVTIEYIGIDLLQVVDQLRKELSAQIFELQSKNIDLTLKLNDVKLQLTSLKGNRNSKIDQIIVCKVNNVEPTMDKKSKDKMDPADGIEYQYFSPIPSFDLGIDSTPIVSNVISIDETSNPRKYSSRLTLL